MMDTTNGAERASEFIAGFRNQNGNTLLMSAVSRDLLI